MNQAKLENFILYLQKEKWQIFGPAKQNFSLSRHDNLEEETPSLIKDRQPPATKPEYLISVKKIKKPDELILDDRLPVYSFKRFFIPESEKLFDFETSQIFDREKNLPKIVIFGINILDLKAVNLYDQVFEKDPYYQARRRNILIVGHAIVPNIEDNIFEYQYEEEILEHLPFDIFLAKNSETPKTYKIFSGSIKGQRILEHFGYKNYQHIQFSGPAKEGEPDRRMKILRNNLENRHNQKIWEELGERCIECGKCTISCPTCFCFRVGDKIEPNQDNLKHHHRLSGSRSRCWDSCFYQEFSEVSGQETPQLGKPKFLTKTSERIHFWYFHKFARIPKEFDFIGCVGCRRCAKVCPVGIDIAQVLKEVERS